MINSKKLILLNFMFLKGTTTFIKLDFKEENLYELRIKSIYNN